MLEKVQAFPAFQPMMGWWKTRQDRSQLDQAKKNLLVAIQEKNKLWFGKGKELAGRVELLLQTTEHNSALKKELAAVERVYYTYLAKMGIPFPPYRQEENQQLVKIFVEQGFDRNFLYSHPEFMTQARAQFWQYSFPVMGLKAVMQNGEPHLPVESLHTPGLYQLTPWSEVGKYNFDEYRWTYRGLARGGCDTSSRLVPLKRVHAAGKHVVQFVVASPGGALPRVLDFARTGHSFTQIIIPDGMDEGEVFSVGFYPRNLSDLGWQLFKRVPGVYRNHDSNVSRIQAGQVIPVVKQYVLPGDRRNSPCLFSIVENIQAVEAAFARQGKVFPRITKEDIDRAIFERNELKLDQITIILSDIRKQIEEGKLFISMNPMSAQAKANIVKQRFEEMQGKDAYCVLGANCTAVSYREEAFIAAFLDAKLDDAPSIRVFDSQVEMRDQKVSLIERIKDIASRILLHFFMALPVTGPLLGMGMRHPDSPDISDSSFVPPILSDTAKAAYAMLMAPFETRPVFPSGEILAGTRPIIEPPSLYQRVRYLWHRYWLLRQ